ncbi:myosin-10 isoform X2 [Mastacembelus armatus]|uniref:myosin-10 isoform X2 n=1 Tax=Mastacembelus armatus TaxID=205130 RepID=UPI000E45F26F|nr:myosin-10-like isoform X2 [Mastacembelus armatus]
MSQKTTPESGVNSKLASLSGETEATEDCGAETNSIAHLLNEFRGLYEQRLRWLEMDTTATQEQLLQKKVDFLRSYVNDFADQNQVLVQNIEYLQKEADQMVSSWGMKLCTYDHILDVSDVDLRSLDELVRPAPHTPHNARSLVYIAEDLADQEECRENLEQRQKTATQVLDNSERQVHLQSELSCLQRIHKDITKEVAEKDICITKLQANIQLLQQEGVDTHTQLSKLNVRVRELQEELKRKEEAWRQKEQKLKLKYKKEHKKAEKRRRQEQQNIEEEWVKKMEEKKRTLEEWKEVIEEERKASAQAVKKWSEKAALLDSELEVRRKQLEQQSSKQSELQQKEETLLAKIKKRELKICALVKEVTESNKQHSDCQKELLQKEKALEKLHKESDELKTKMEDQNRACVHLNQTRERMEADLALSHEKLNTLHLEVRSRDQLIVQLRAEMKAAGQKHQETLKQVTVLQGEVRHLNHEVKGHQEETFQLSKKVLDIEHLKEQAENKKQQLHNQLYISQQQLRETQLAAHSVKEELAELERQYQERVGQWERSQEALDQLTDEFQANQNLLRESQQKVDHFKSQMVSMQEQLDTLKQQKVMLEQDLQLYQQGHSHSDEEYLSLVKDRQLLHKRCTEQVERLVECERAILQMKSELERQTQEKTGLKRVLAASHNTHLSNRSQMEQEVTRLKKEVTHLQLVLVDAQKVHEALHRQSEDELEGARQEVVRRSREVDVQKGEVQRLQDNLQKEEEKLRSAFREKQSLYTYIKQLSQELEELHCKHQVTVEVLAAHAEKARQMEGCLNEGKLAEEKIRSMAIRLETEVTDLRKNLQQAVNQKLKAEKEKQDAQDQVDKLQAELEGTRSANANLCHESHLVMTNVNRWITEQKASNESLTAQINAQNKVLLIVTDEKGHLQETNDMLKAEIKKLKKTVDVKERDMERLKAQIWEQGIQQDKKTMDNQDCVALNLCKIEDMQTRLRSNLEAIGMLNQQLNALSRENKQLRRQLEEEMSMRKQVERLLPPLPIFPHRSSIHLPISLSAHPSPLCSSRPSSLPLPRPLHFDPVTGDTDGIQTQTKLSQRDQVIPRF